MQRFLAPDGPTSIVAILNLTPDSFFDGGKYGSVDGAVAQARKFLEDGADILELGAESTGPKSPDVSIAEEKMRLLPALEAIRLALPDAFIAVDTYKSDIASAALDLGADLINDVTAGRGDAEMFRVVASHHCPIVLMHSKDATPRTTIEPCQYDDVVSHIRTFLEERIDRAIAAGIDRKKIIIDPGLGHFISSDPRYSREILDRLEELTTLAPVLVSPSRKSFLAGPGNLPARDRLHATIAANVTAAKSGARFIRTHDVRETVSALRAL